VKHAPLHLEGRFAICHLSRHCTRRWWWVTHAVHVQALEAEVKQLRREAKAAQSLVLKDELKSRRRVLRRLGYITDEGVVTDKGAN
jgi:superfamily II RNA helicase